MRRNLLSILKLCLIIICTSFGTASVFYAGKAFFGTNDISRDLSSVMDWHDYRYMAEDRGRYGLGEQGRGEFLDNRQKIAYDYERLFNENGFNGALSDLISVNRSVPDIRHSECHKKKYLKNLLSVSVIVPFYNEHKSTLLRTVYSVLNRSPDDLIHEIILVNDSSSKKFEIDPIAKVKIINLSSRQGLIRARLAGAKVATGEVLIFLDSHVEANVNWLPPLIEPITKDYRICTCPFIDVISFDTFEYRAQDEGARGAFDWEMYYKRLRLLPKNVANPSELFENPVMAGGLFAISAKFFWELGGYDEQLEIWGGEQYELSFKIWQCGGQMFDVPCSRVGHIYRKFSPFSNSGKGDFLGKNLKRVAEVWMDEYAEYIYKRRPHYRNIDAGDLTKQKALRENLKCKPFKWFMKNIAFDLTKKYPPIEPDNFANGSIRSQDNPSLCLDADNGKQDSHVKIAICQVGHPEQRFILSWQKSIRLEQKTMCLDVSRSGYHAPISLYPCHGEQGNQLWTYDKDNFWLVHGANKRCLEYEKSNVFVSKCQKNNTKQKWLFG